MNTQCWQLTENGPLLEHRRGRPNLALLNANPFAEGIANLGAQVIARAMIDHGWNLDFSFADTCTRASPFIANLAGPAEMDVLAFSIPFEDTYHHVPRMLRMCGLDPWAHRRTGDDPLVVAGGMALINPMPLAPFFDVMVIGEGREVLPRIADLVLEHQARQGTRGDLLRAVAQLPHTLVPSLYDMTYDDLGCVDRFEPVGGAAEQVHAARPLDMTAHPIQSEWTTQRACYKYPDYFSVMVAMGCHLKCPFCVVGNVQGAESGRALNIERDKIVELAVERRRAYGTNLVKLFFASSFAKQASMDPLSLTNLLDTMLAEDFECRVGSLNVRQANDELLRLVKRAGQDRVTFAPETGAALRQSIGKPYSKDEKLLEVAAMLHQHGLGLDLYTMIGVPGEEPRHIAELADLITKVRTELGPQQTLEVSLNPAFAKAQTPYERWATLRPEESRRRFAFLRSRIPDWADVRWVSVIDDAMSYYQPILALGGPELAAVLDDVSTSYQPSETQWREAISRLVPGGDRRYFAAKPDDRRLPWQHIVFNDHRRLALRLDAHKMRVQRG
ncbi:B12-binding domain-containing radical SAM protein [Allorhizocola rhizosphaerae]|uniref:B12-binding domain-containing radical SAM protein n=1 Tax=Allorhizocola rhizosphaerae TaxID=1872709 RepID=UPI000E3C6342|nr:radical SAM protein [Allorhizocola rhizosphaerae]